MIKKNLFHLQIFIVIFSTLLACLAAAPCVAQQEKQILTLQSFAKARQESLIKTCGAKVADIKGVLLTLALDALILAPSKVVEELRLTSIQLTNDVEEQYIKTTQMIPSPRWYTLN